MAVTITWDGDITGKTEVSGFYKVTDRKFTAEEFEGGTILTNLLDTPRPITEFAEVNGSIVFGCGENGGSGLSTDEGEMDGIVFPEKGTYFIKLKLGQQEAYLKELYLPNAKEETKPLAEITYNGETIAQLNAGETATLSCEGKKMVSDVVISTNSEYKIPKLETAVVEPIPEVQIVKPSSGYDGFSQITVGAKTATPIEVGNATVMAMYLESAEVGSIYKYTGETDDTYENGALYVVEESGE